MNVSVEKAVRRFLSRWFASDEIIEDERAPAYVLLNDVDFWRFEGFVRRHKLTLVNSRIRTILEFVVPDVLFHRDNVFLSPCSDVPCGTALFLKLSQGFEKECCNEQSSGQD